MKPKKKAFTSKKSRDSFSKKLGERVVKSYDYPEKDTGKTIYAVQYLSQKECKNRGIPYNDPDDFIGHPSMSDDYGSLAFNNITDDF